MLVFHLCFSANDMVLSASSGGNCQLSLGWFTAECEAVEMRISTSKSEIMVHSCKRVECPLQVGSEVLPQMEEFKYDLRTLYESVVMKRVLSQKVRRLISLSLFLTLPMVMNCG